jgi:hypothetical protein
MTENPVHPSYYLGGEVHEFENCLEAWQMHFNAYRYQAIVYLARAGKKPGVDELRDIKAALHYVEKEKERLEAKKQEEAWEKEG